LKEVSLKDVSLFEEALKIAGTAGAEDLGRVSTISRRDFDERQSFLFRTKTPCLEYISLMIENALLLRTNRTGRLYAGFEKLSRMEAVAERYLRIADVSERVYIFGEADWKPPRHPNMKVITFPGDYKLVHEWFVIADSSTLRVAFIAVEEDRSVTARALEERNFRAFKSSDPAIVAQLVAKAEALIDSSMAA
jgi:hypothetical protein